MARNGSAYGGLCGQGHIYDFTAYVKLQKGSVTKGKSHLIRVTLWFQLSNMAEPMWMRICEIEGVTSDEWIKVFGCLNMPDGGPDVSIVLAELYFEGPPPGTNFMCAETSLIDTGGKVPAGKNLFINPDFQQLNGPLPMGWHGRGANIFVPKDIKFNGKNCCLVNNRHEHWQGPAQMLVRFVENGHAYKFSAHVRLGPDTPKGKSDKVRVSFYYKLTNMPSHGYMMITEVYGVTSEKWVKVAGVLNFPHNSPDVLPEHAEFYIEVPQKGISLLCAETSLKDITNSVAEVESSMAAMHVGKEGGALSTEKKATLTSVVKQFKTKGSSASVKPSMASVNVPTENSDLQEPKEVFISYQWDIQDWVRVLRDKLEKSGITCWMDIGQMGGGDALFAEIDAGMRGAKVVISCVTPKYTKSENCQRELTLADCLKKPIIPLLFDNANGWPPPGQMSLIFAKLLYIDMTGKQNHIPQKKFEELVETVKSRIE